MASTGSLLYLGALSLAVASLGCSDDTNSGGQGGAAGNSAGASGGSSGGGAGGAGGSAGATSAEVEVFAELGASSEGVVIGKDPSGAPQLYVSLNGSDRIVTVSTSGVVADFIDIPTPLGMALTSTGDLLVCGKDSSSGSEEGVIWKVTPQGDASVFIRGAVEPFEVTNYVAVAPDDKIAFSDSAAERVYLTDPQGENLSILTSEIPYPNGMAFSADGRQLFVASWNSESVWSIARDPNVGNFGPASSYLQDAPAVDGLVAMQGGDLVLVTSADGILRATSEGSTQVAPAETFKLPANGAFGVGGYDPNWLYVTNLISPQLHRVRFSDTGLVLPVR